MQNLSVVEAKALLDMLADTVGVAKKGKYCKKLVDVKALRTGWHAG